MWRLVLADDSITIQKVIELSFADEDFEVCSFPDGASALQHLHSNPVDVLLADVSLPFMDGYALCLEVRKDPVNSRIPVILLAGTFEPFDLKRAERVGFSGHLTKPFETSKLVALVKQVLTSEPPSVVSAPARSIWEESDSMPPEIPDSEAEGLDRFDALEGAVNIKPVEAEPMPAKGNDSGAPAAVAGALKPFMAGLLVPMRIHPLASESRVVLFRLDPDACAPWLSILDRDVVIGRVAPVPVAIPVAPVDAVIPAVEERTEAGSIQVKATEPSSQLSPQDLELLTERILERLPGEIRRMLPDITREVLNQRWRPAGD